MKKYLPRCSTILEFCGAWPSPKYYRGWRKVLYDFYTLIIVLLIFTICLSGVIQLCIFTRNVNEFATNGYMLLTLCTMFSKAFTIILKRDYLAKAFDSMEEEKYQAKNEEEKRIQDEWNPHSSSSPQAYRFLVMASIFAVTVTSFEDNIPSRTLLFGGWFPYNHTDGIGFGVAFIHQLIVHNWGALIGSSIDAVIYGTLIQTCGQLKIFGCRLRKIPEVIRQNSRLPKNDGKNNNGTITAEEWERKVVVDCIRHHLHILQFSETCNNIYSIVIFSQFLASGVIICICVILLTKMKFMGSEYIFMLSYLACMVTQIFFYCWFGNEVILESLNIDSVIYEMDWSELSLNTQKDLMIIMTRSMYPIEFTSGKMVTLSINSFNAVMKLSYSVYNVLGQKG